MKHVIVLYPYKHMSFGDSMKTYPTLQKALQTYKIGRCALFFHRCESIVLIFHVDGVRRDEGCVCWRRGGVSIMRCHSQSSQELKLAKNQYTSQICRLHHHLVWMDYYERLLRGMSLTI